MKTLKQLKIVEGFKLKKSIQVNELRVMIKKAVIDKEIIQRIRPKKLVIEGSKIIGLENIEGIESLELRKVEKEFRIHKKMKLKEISLVDIEYLQCIEILQ